MNMSEIVGTKHIGSGLFAIFREKKNLLYNNANKEEQENNSNKYISEAKGLKTDLVLKLS